MKKFIYSNPTNFFKLKAEKGWTAFRAFQTTATKIVFCNKDFERRSQQSFTT